MTLAHWMWLLPILPLLGFVINGWLSLAGAKLGPDDPTLIHDAVEVLEGRDKANATLDSDAEAHGAVGDDHHAVARHRWAGVVSIVGPGVLILSFLLAAGIFREMLGA